MPWDEVVHYSSALLERPDFADFYAQIQVFFQAPKQGPCPNGNIWDPMQVQTLISTHRPGGTAVQHFSSIQSSVLVKGPR